MEKLDAFLTYLDGWNKVLDSNGLELSMEEKMALLSSMSSELTLKELILESVETCIFHWTHIGTECSPHTWKWTQERPTEGSEP